MASGIGVNDEIVDIFQSLKLSKKIRYFIAKMNDDLTEVVVEKTGGRDETWESFVDNLPDDDCRYAVFDYEFDAGEGQRNKLIFVVWCPDTARIKPKMLYTSTKDAVKKKLVGVSCELQATDDSEVSNDAAYALATKFT
eukprot:TRINITY_DN14512_c0_g1_i1.p1 TRINITY_DN14512_c0_g1~~TRINITY_DN14512_c0_g1_i1.p1  ORF type:complete len:139 (-),score=46.53 TRINITY_DN14512_c0_g1_i1:76-492(-)